MDQNQAQIISNVIIKDIFGPNVSFTLEEIKKRFTSGIPLPEKLNCSISGEEVFLYDPQPSYKIISENSYTKIAESDGWIKPKKSIKNIEELLKHWEEINYMSGSKVISSKEVSESDSITSCSNIFGSTLISSSKNIILSHNNFNSNYLLCSRGNNSCNLGLRLFDSLYSSSSYEVRWSNKISKSMFINDCLDLYECLFCYGIRSKKYCIANMQFEKPEYDKIKEMVIDWIKNK